MSGLLGRTPATAPAGGPGRIDVSGPATRRDRCPGRPAADAAGRLRRALPPSGSPTGECWSSTRRPGGCCSCCSWPRAAARCWPCSAARRSRAAAMHAARAARRDRDAGPRADGGRATRAPAPARALGRALRRPRPRPRGHPGDRVALRRVRRVDPPDGAAGRARLPRDRRAAHLLAGPRAAPACCGSWAWSRCSCSTAPPWPSTTRRAARCAGSCCSCWWAPGCGCRASSAARRASPPRWCERRGPLPAARGRARRRSRLVGLPRLELVRRRQGPHLRLEPLLRAARLVARGHDRPERQVGPAALLEGRDARRLRRPALVPHRRVRRDELGPEVAFTESIIQGRWNYNEYNQDWDERIRFTVRSLSSPFVVGAGVVLRVDGVPARTAGDGTRGSWPGTGSRRATPTRCAHTYPTRRGSRCRTRPRATRRRRSGTRRSSCRTRASPPPPSSPTRRWRIASRRRFTARRCTCRCAATRPPDSGPQAAQRILNSPYAPMYAPGARPDAEPADRLRRGQERRALAAAQLPLLRARADAPDPADGLPRGGQARLLPAVLRHDGADAAHGRAFRRAWPPASRPARTTRTPASTACATSTRTPGSRSGSPASAGCRSTRRPRARPRSRSRARFAASAAAADAAARRAAIRGAQTQERTSGSAADAAGGDRRRLDRARRDPAADRWRPLAGAALAGRPAACSRLRAAAPDGVAAAQLSELRRALLRLGWDLPASTTLLGARAAARALRRPSVGGLRGRPARQPLRPARARRPEPAAAARGAPRAHAAGACSTGCGA